MPVRPPSVAAVGPAGLALAIALAGCGYSCGQAALAPYPVAVPQTQLDPPPYTVSVDDPAGAAGYVFLDNGGFDPAVLRPGAGPPTKPPTGPRGLEIVDKQGRPVWFGQLPADAAATNLQVQTYRGQPVLTFWQGRPGAGDAFGHGDGVNYLLDDHYRVIATVNPDGLTADLHEFRLTPDGRALTISYVRAPADLSSVGGPVDGTVWDCVAAVVDVATNTTLHRWSAAAHVPVADSVIGPTGGRVFDAYHMNSVALAPDGDLLISMRHTAAVYKVNPATGAIAWQLGGERSTFALGPGVQFAFQHDAQFTDPQTVVLFNNDTDGVTTLGRSSVQWIRLDETARTATLLRDQTHPGGVQAAAMGSVQLLPDGNTFVGWGTGQHVSEFTPSGELVYDARTPQGAPYRAHLASWDGEPVEAPQLSIAADAVTAFWNGATRVRRWRLLRGDSAADLRPVATVDWAGLATVISLPAGTPGTGWFAVQALDEAGSVIGRSEPTRR